MKKYYIMGERKQYFNVESFIFSFANNTCESTEVSRGFEYRGRRILINYSKYYSYCRIMTEYVK